jgi:hypothetical protein
MPAGHDIVDDRVLGEDGAIRLPIAVVHGIAVARQHLIYLNPIGDLLG